MHGEFCSLPLAETDRSPTLEDDVEEGTVGRLSLLSLETRMQKSHESRLGWLF